MAKKKISKKVVNALKEVYQQLEKPYYSPDDPNAPHTVFDKYEKYENKKKR